MFLSSSVYCEATTTASVKLTANRDFIENGEQVEISLNILGYKTASYLAHIYFDNTKLDFISGPENIVVDQNHIKILWYDTQRRKWGKTRRT